MIRYPCDQCDYAATRYDDLKRRKKTHHSTPLVIKERNDMVLIEKLDMSKYEIAQVQSKIIEPMFIEKSNLSEVDTEIKNEAEIDEKYNKSDTENTIVRDSERKVEFLNHTNSIYLQNIVKIGEKRRYTCEQ